MIREALKIDIEGKTVLTVGSLGEKVYAPGYDAESVIEELVVFGLESLSAVERYMEEGYLPELPETGTIRGLHLVVKRI